MGTAEGFKTLRERYYMSARELRDTKQQVLLLRQQHWYGARRLQRYIQNGFPKYHPLRVRCHARLSEIELQIEVLQHQIAHAEVTEESSPIPTLSTAIRRASSVVKGWLSQRRRKLRLKLAGS